jgi:hypothetical protein
MGLADEKAFGSELDKLIYLGLRQSSRTVSGRFGGLRSRNHWWEPWQGVRKLCG